MSQGVSIAYSTFGHESDGSISWVTTRRMNSSGSSSNRDRRCLDISILLFSDHWSIFWGPIQLKLGHPYDIGRERLNCPKTYASSPVTYDQTVHNLKVFACGSIFRTLRPFIILHALPPCSNFRSPFIHRAVRRRLIPNVYNDVIKTFLRGYALLTEVIYDCTNFNFFFHFLSLTHPFPVCSKVRPKTVALKFYSFYQRCWIR